MTDKVIETVLVELDTLLNITKQKIFDDGIAFENQWMNLKEYYHGQGAEDAQGVVFQLQAWRDDYVGLIERIEKMNGDYQIDLASKGRSK